MSKPKAVKVLTVRKLRELLKGYKASAVVWVEGCDCVAEAVDVEPMGSTEKVLITRS